MRHGPRALLAAAACLFAPSAVFAQQCDTCGTAGPRVGNSYGRSTKHCNGIYPKFESRYIKQFCGPHVSPDACFGYFRTRVTPWAEACPNYGGHEAPTTGPGSVQVGTATPAPAAIPPAAPAPAARPADAPAPAVPAPDAPKAPTGPLPSLSVPAVPTPMPR